MSKFKYKAHRPGEEVDVIGEAEAEDKFHLSRQMRDQGLVLISATVASNRWFDPDRINEIVIVIKLHDKVTFANNLSAMLSAGLSLSKSLDVLYRQTKNLKLKRALKEILKDVNSGLSLSESLAKFPHIFSSVFVAMVAAGEQSGNLPQSLKLLGDQMEKTYALHRKLRGAMAYPAVIFLAMIIIGFLMLTFVVPNLVSTFREFNIELPLSTRIIIGLSDTLVNYWVYFLVGMIGIIFGSYKFSRTEIGKHLFDFTILHIPMISGVVKQVNSATAARTLSSLIMSGVNMVESLEITSKVLQNSFYKTVLIKARDGVQKGDSLSGFFQHEENLFPILVGEMIEVGEETGKLAEMLSNVAKFYEDEVDSITKDISTIIEPFMMIIIGLLVGFFAVSMIQPIYSITTAI
ncbi:MAG: type II secretion system F family protein [bacterium]|nr:type II secretion system F family protein [bacterium]